MDEKAEVLCYRLNVRVPHNIHMFYPDSQCVGIWRRGIFWVIRAFGGSAFMTRISALIKRIPGILLASSTM